MASGGLLFGSLFIIAEPGENDLGMLEYLVEPVCKRHAVAVIERAVVRYYRYGQDAAYLYRLPPVRSGYDDGSVLHGVDCKSRCLRRDYLNKRCKAVLISVDGAEI